VVTRDDIKDGTSTTILVIETNRDVGPWAAGGAPTLRPVDTNDQRYLGVGRAFGGIHVRDQGWFRKSRVVYVGFVDGSVRWLAESLNPQTFEALVTIAGGETIAADDF
jgi:hypothetical protein